jgi:hypothetical protein
MVMLELSVGRLGCGEVKQGAARGVVRCCGTKGAFYKLGEVVEGRRSVGEVSFNLIGFDNESRRGVDEASS